MKTSRITVALLATLGLAAAPLAVAAPAQAVATAHRTVTVSTAGDGTWTVPANATGVTATLRGSASEVYGGAVGHGGVATYSLPGLVGGSSVVYQVGSTTSGSQPVPNQRTNLPGGGGTAIAVGGQLLAVVGGGGGVGQLDPLDDDTTWVDGGTGGVATVPGVAAGGDGLPAFVGSAAPGQGGQPGGGGATSTTASYSGSAQYGGADGDDGPPAVVGGAIRLAAGGYAGHLGGGGGSGYTGGGGGTCDFELPTGSFDDGAGGGGSGYLAASGIAYVAGTAGTNAGAGSIVFAFDVPVLVVTPSTTVGGDAGQSYSWTPLAVTGGSAPYAYSIAGGALPDGLALAADGTISGIPTTPGPATFTVRVTDGAGQTDDVPLQITIGSLSVTAPVQAAIGGALTLTGSGYDAGDYDVVLGADAIGTAHADASGDLTFSGTVPAGATVGSTTVQVVAGGVEVASAPIDLVEGLGASAAPAVDAFQGEPYSWTPLTVVGGTAPLAYALTGPLPAGLTLDATTGEISGTPTTATVVPMAFSITVTDSSGVPQSATVPLDLAVGTLQITAPASIQAGAAFRITGTGFSAGDYTVELHSTPVVLGTAHVGAGGALAFSGVVPAASDPGAHRLQVLRNGIVVAEAAVTVTAAPTALASTGVDPLSAWWLALLGLVAGAALVVIRARRRSRLG